MEFWNRLWIKGRVLASQLVLLLIFLVFVFPLALLFRILGRDTLRLRRSQDNSAFKVREHKYSAADFQRPY